MNTTKTAALNRWYVVADKLDNARCLVEANAPGQALRRAAEYYCNVRTATVAETIEMIRSECDVISAPQSPEQLEIEDQISKQSNSAIPGEPGPSLATQGAIVGRAAEVFATLTPGDASQLTPGDFPNEE